MTHMPNDLGSTLRDIVEREANLLSAINESDAGHKPSPSAWSKKQELGHLIDSAANNHVRFVVASIQDEFRGPGYAQDAWVDRHAYNEVPWTEILDFWKRYNHFLADLIQCIPDDRLQTACVVGENPTATLQFLIEDYTLHMQHHLDHILRRAKITQYPSAALRD